MKNKRDRIRERRDHKKAYAGYKSTLERTAAISRAILSNSFSSISRYSLGTAAEHRSTSAMALKFFILLVSIAAANAGLALTSTSDNTYRSLGNLAQVSTQSKTIETPYSSSSKSDIRVSNPSVYASPAPIGHYVSAAPAVHQYSSAPVIQHYSQAPIHHGQEVYASAPGPIISKTAYAGPAAPAIQYAHQSPIAQPIYAHPAPVSYAQHAPVHYAQPAPVHYAQPTPVHYAQHAPVAYAQPAQVSYAHAAPVSYSAHAAHQVAFSPASAVAHLTYNNVNDHVNYAW